MSCYRVLSDNLECTKTVKYSRVQRTPAPIRQCRSVPVAGLGKMFSVLVEGDYTCKLCYYIAILRRYSELLQLYSSVGGVVVMWCSVGGEML